MEIRFKSPDKLEKTIRAVDTWSLDRDSIIKSIRNLHEEVSGRGLVCLTSVLGARSVSISPLLIEDRLAAGWPKTYQCKSVFIVDDKKSATVVTRYAFDNPKEGARWQATVRFGRGLKGLERKDAVLSVDDYAECVLFINSQKKKTRDLAELLVEAFTADHG